MDENNGLEKEEGQLLKVGLEQKMYGKEGRNSKYINNVMLKLEMSLYHRLKVRKLCKIFLIDLNLEDITNEALVM